MCCWITNLRVSPQVDGTSIRQPRPVFGTVHSTLRGVSAAQQAWKADLSPSGIIGPNGSPAQFISPIATQLCVQLAVLSGYTPCAALTPVGLCQRLWHAMLFTSYVGLPPVPVTAHIAAWQPLPCCFVLLYATHTKGTVRSLILRARSHGGACSVERAARKVP